MSKIGLIFLFILMAAAGYGQQDHFVLIQADNDQPFYVRLRDQTLSSSAQGHLILSQLSDSVYPITIGFPGQQFPERDFTLTIDKKDLEFRLKYLEGQDWALLNVETQELQMPKTDTMAGKTHSEGVKKDDAFSRLMAGVVSDTAVMYSTYAAIAARDSSAHRDSSAARKDSSAAMESSIAREDSGFAHKDSPIARMDSSVGRKDSPAVRRDSAIATISDTLASKADSPRVVSITLTDMERSSYHPPPIPAQAFAQPPPRGSSIKSVTQAAKPVHIRKISEQKTATALRLVYADGAKGHKTDTIRIQIALDTIVRPGDSQPDTGMAGSRPKAAGTATGEGADSLKSSGPDRSPITNVKPVLINSDCRNYASDEDVDKLKLKMEAVPDDGVKITAARKVFKIKCLSTSQLRTLSEAFASEGSKYSFLETAYPFDSDDRFRELSVLFTDPVYIAKFKTLVGPASQ